MRARIARTSPAPVHAVKVGDTLRARHTGEERTVVTIARTLTEFTFGLDDGTWIEAGVLDTVFVVNPEGVSDAGD